MIALDGPRSLAVAAVLLAYAGLCGAVGWRHRAQGRAAAREAAALQHPGAGGRRWLVLYASQTGTAEAIAHQTAQALHAAGQGVVLLTLRELALARLAPLAQATHALLVVSTYGEGDPPDNAAGFLEALEAQGPDLAALQYGVLALGDRSYQHFCGFGLLVDVVLSGQGARPLFERIDVDRGDEAALERWQQALLRHASAVAELPAVPDAPFEPWTLVGRRQLNPGSAGGAVWMIRLVPAAGEMPAWESGDLAQLLPPGEGMRPRDYSIASIASDGALELIVRLSTRPDGSPGLASGWLCHAAVPGDILALRLRPHRLFRLGENARRPLLLIGNGTGIAGLRGHLRARQATGVPAAWLVFGERNAAFDTLLADELKAWHAAGVLTRTDLVFSRDQAEHPYVQDRLQTAAAAVREWVEAGAAIYVCGSLQGMASGVDAALRAILGDVRLEALATAGRYRRDVY